jgi:chemotaxis protein MotA
VIALTTKLMKLLRTEGPVAMESHVQDPKQPDLRRISRLLANHELID